MYIRHNNSGFAKSTAGVRCTGHGQRACCQLCLTAWEVGRLNYDVVVAADCQARYSLFIYRTARLIGTLVLPAYSIRIVGHLGQSLKVVLYVVSTIITYIHQL